MWRFRGFPQWQLALFCRRQRWVLTAQGWLIVLSCLILLFVGSLLQVYPFLAVNSPIQANTLVVEGWVHDQNLQDALTEFKSRPYQLLLTTGGPIPVGSYLVQYRTYADLAAATLKQLGMDQSQLVAVPAPDTVKDRTYTSALALKQWLDQSHPSIHAIDVLTAGPHARRSWMLFRKALAPRQVGILVSPDPEYDPQRWWTSSAGFRSVTGELIAYLYAWVFNIFSR